jgi:hypothetical protein
VCSSEDRGQQDMESEGKIVLVIIEALENIKKGLD